MKKYLILVLVFLVLLGCKEKQYVSKKHEIRQLVKTERISQYSTASFFLLAGTYSSGSRADYKINMFAKDKYGFVFLEIPLYSVSVFIDNTLEKPYLETLTYYEKELDLKFLVYSARIDSEQTILIIHCPEKYLPEKLLPIEIGGDQ